MRKKYVNVKRKYNNCEKTIYNNIRIHKKIKWGQYLVIPVSKWKIIVEIKIDGYLSSVKTSIWSYSNGRFWLNILGEDIDDITIKYFW